MKKIVRIGTIKIGPNAENIFAKIEYTNNGKLSISGVIGPMRNGNAHGSCGQFIMSFKEYDKRGYDSINDIIPAPGWSYETIKRFFDAWDKWHLNDMRPNCAHQIGAEWTPQEVTLYHYTLTADTLHEKKQVEDRALRALRNGQSFTPSPHESFIAALPYSITTDNDTIPEFYQRASDTSYSRARETKWTNWLYPKDHSQGFLTKECPVCGYKYGTAWKHENVPQDILEFLFSLPDTDIAPAWV